MQPCPEDVVPMVDNPARAAEIAWIVLIVAVLIFEGWAIRTHHNTLSQAVQHKKLWFRWLAEIGVAVLGLHLLGVL